MPLIKGSAPKSSDTDPNFKDVSLLIQPEAHHSEDEVSYNVFNDASTNKCRIDAHGTNGDENDTRPVGTGFSPYEKNGYYSVEFGETTPYLTIPTQTYLYPQAGNFSFECFIYWKIKSGTSGFFGFSGGTGGTAKFMWIIEPSGRIQIHTNGFGTQSWYSGDYRLPEKKWTFLCFRKTDGNMELFADGKSVASSSWTNVTINASHEWRIGYNGESGQALNGFMSNVRWRVGTISDGSMPSKPLTPEKGTKILACLGNNFNDQSIELAPSYGVNYSQTFSPAVRTFNPFNLNSRLFSPNGYHSVKFDGDSYLKVASSTDFAFPTGTALTIEAWVYPNMVGSANDTIVSLPVTNGFTFVYLSGSAFGVKLYGGATVSTGAIPVLHQWNHIKYTRDTANNGYLYLNGVLQNQVTDSNAYATGELRIGGDAGASNYFNGYISNLRIVKGSSSISATQPTDPLTDITNTKFLGLQSTAFRDNSSSQHSVLWDGTEPDPTTSPFNPFTLTKETIKVTVASVGGGNKFLFNNESVASKPLAHMSGVTYRFDLSDSSTASHPFKLSETIDGSHTKQDGYYAMEFGGDDAIETSEHPDFHLSDNDYTIEFWIRNPASAYQYICSDGDSNGQNYGFHLRLTSTNSIMLKTTNQSTTVLNSGVSISANTWTHVAVVRQSGTTRIYQGGVQRATTTSYPYYIEGTNKLNIGRNGQNNSNDFEGYLSNFHIINGFCKYPDGTTYTPPTTPTQPHAMTVLLCCQSASINQDNSGTNKPIEEVNTPTTGTSVVPFSSVPDGSIYSTDVTVSGTQGQSGAYLEYKSTTSTPDLNYYCTAHSGMGGKIISGEDYTRRNVNDGSMFNAGETGSHAQAHLLSAIGTGDFQISFWFNAEEFATNDYLISFRGSNESVAGAFGFGINANGQQVMYTSSYQLNGGSITARKFNWNFMQLRRKGTTCYIKMNGKQAGTFTYSDNISRTIFGIGGNSYTNYGDEFKGYIADVKVESVSGLDRVPTIPRTADSNTKMLTCQYSGGARNTGMIDKAFPSRKVSYFEEEVSMSSFSPYLPDGYWSAYLGSSDNYYISFDGSNDFAFGTGDFQIEMFIRLNIVGSNQDLYDSRASAGDNKVHLRVDSSNVLKFMNNTTRITGTTALVVGRWYHVCLSRVSGSTRLFLDGSQEGSTYSDSITYANDSSRPTIGVAGYTLGNNDFKGYISNLRIKKGSGVSSVTVPISPLQSDSNTVFLGFQSNRFIDNSDSGNADVITKVGHPKCLFESPFNIDSDNFPYSKENHGGSLTFDGTNDGVQIQNRNFDEFDMMNTHSFCFEYWVYMESFPSAWKRHWEQDGNKWSLRFLGSTGVLALDPSPSPSHGSHVQDSSAIPVGEWVHYAITYDDDDNNTLRMFRNGVQVDEQTGWTQAWTSGGAYTHYLQNKYFGGWGYSPDAYFSDLRLTRNEPVYTENFTPRTTPATLSSEVRNQANVKMLYNFDNAGIYDQSGRMTFVNFEQDYSGDNSKTVMVSSAKSKNGLGSLFFDEGTTLRTRMNQESVNILTGEFTIEFFVYFLNNPNSSNQSIVRNDASFIIQRYGNEWEVGNEPTPQIQVVQSLSTGQWYYLALTRNSSNLLRLYAGAVTGSTVSSLGTASNYTTSVSSNFYFGSYGISGGSRSLKGYIDQLRITRANRYGTKSSIDVPTKLFPRR